MRELDLNDDKSELIKMVAKGFVHISRVMLDDHWSSFMDVLIQSTTLIVEKLIHQQHFRRIHLHNDRKFSTKMTMHAPPVSTRNKNCLKKNVLNKFFGRQTVQIWILLKIFGRLSIIKIHNEQR